MPILPFGSSSNISRSRRFLSFTKIIGCPHQVTAMSLPQLCCLNEAAPFRLPHLMLNNEATAMRLPQLCCLNDAAPFRLPHLMLNNEATLMRMHAPIS